MKLRRQHLFKTLAGLTLSFHILLFLFSCAATEAEEEKTNQLSDLRVCTAPVDNRCEESATEVAVDTRFLYTTATVNRAVEGTEALATLTLIHEGEKKKILSYSVGIEPDEDSGTALLVFFFDSSGNTEHGGRWLAGQYEIEVEVHAAGAQPLRTTVHLV